LSSTNILHNRKAIFPERLTGYIYSWYKYGMDKKYTLERLDDAKLYSFKIEVSLLEWLREEANRRKISVSQLIRDAIEFYMKLSKVEA